MCTFFIDLSPYISSLFLHFLPSHKLARKCSPSLWFIALLILQPYSPLMQQHTEPQDQVCNQPRLKQQPLGPAALELLEVLHTASCAQSKQRLDHNFLLKSSDDPPLGRTEESLFTVIFKVQHHLISANISVGLCASLPLSSCGSYNNHFRAFPPPTLLFFSGSLCTIFIFLLHPLLEIFLHFSQTTLRVMIPSCQNSIWHLALNPTHLYYSKHMSASIPQLKKQTKANKQQ